eukprot:COSAG01_NODE_15726_length_1306_cov_1.097763_2_plen_73_part_00
MDFVGLELIEMRLEIDVPKLLRYLEEHSDFPPGGASVRPLPAPRYQLPRNAAPFRWFPYTHPTPSQLAVRRW